MLEHQVLMVLQDQLYVTAVSDVLTGCTCAGCYRELMVGKALEEIRAHVDQLERRECQVMPAKLVPRDQRLVQTQIMISFFPVVCLGSIRS